MFLEEEVDVGVSTGQTDAAFRGVVVEVVRMDGRFGVSGTLVWPSCGVGRRRGGGGRSGRIGRQNRAGAWVVPRELIVQ